MLKPIVVTEVDHLYPGCLNILGVGTWFYGRGTKPNLGAKP